MDPHARDPHAHTWPVWTVVLCSLLACLWMSDSDAQADALRLLGHASSWEAGHARAFSGHWYVVAHRAPAADPECARDLTADYRLRASGQFDYAMRCTGTDGSARQYRGVAGWEGEPGGEKASLARQWGAWWGTWLKAFTPNAWERQDILLVDHVQGLAAVSDRGAQGLVLIARRPTLDESHWQPFLARLTDEHVDWCDLQPVRHTGVPVQGPFY